MKSLISWVVGGLLIALGCLFAGKYSPIPGNHFWLVVILIGAGIAILFFLEWIAPVWDMTKELFKAFQDKDSSKKDPS